MSAIDPRLKVEHLSVRIHSEERDELVVRDVSFTINPGETVALVGESGSGKSMTGYAIMGLLPGVARVEPGGSIWFTEQHEVAPGSTDFQLVSEGRELLLLDEGVRRSLRGTSMAMVFQEPMTALNPATTVGDQLAEVLIEHRNVSRKIAREVALEKLRLVGIPSPEQRMKSFPHELSGGLRQRVVIAMALMADAQLLVADEPTTALDVTIQQQILELLKDLQKQIGVSILLITHDMGVVADMAHHVCVMRSGEIVEQGEVQKIFEKPEHAYTRRLLSAVPVIGQARDTSVVTSAEDRPLVSIRNLSVHFGVRQGLFGRAVNRAVNDVSLDIYPGETLALVGESGCGKTTLGRSLVGLSPIASGEIHFDGKNTTRFDAEALRFFRRRVSIIFQDPKSSLNPTMRVLDLIGEPLMIHKIGTPEEQRNRVFSLMQRVGLSPDMGARFPHEFSGGQRQRISIARALVLRPQFVVCDEPTSALDVSIQADVLQLLKELKEELGLTLLFISHNLGVVDLIADRVAVMYLGRIVEIGPAASVIRDPKHPYTQALLSASPIPSPEAQRSRTRIALRGSPPSAIHPPTGCSFHPRCPMATQDCAVMDQLLLTIGDDRRAACGLLTH